MAQTWIKLDNKVIKWAKRYTKNEIQAVIKPWNPSYVIGEIPSKVQSIEIKKTLTQCWVIFLEESRCSPPVGHGSTLLHGSSSLYNAYKLIANNQIE